MLGDPTVSSIMSTGLRLSFHSLPPLSFTPPSRALPNPAQLPMIRPFLPHLLSRGIVREITSPHLLFFSRIFVVPKKDGPMRLVIDLSLLNKLLLVPTFKMETVSRIAKGLVGPLWGCTIDLQDAYFHVPVDWHFHMYLAFVVDDRVYVFQYLPFGLASAPWAFSRIIKPVKAHLHHMAVLISSYLDDFLLLNPSSEGLLHNLSEVLSLFKRLGIRVKHEKSHLVPSQKVLFLGVLFHLDTMDLSLPSAKIASISALCQETLGLSLMSRRSLESLLGTLNFASDLLPLGRLYLLPLIQWMNFHTSPSTRDLPVRLDQSFKSRLQVWSEPTFLSGKVPMSIPTPTLQLMTDASEVGWSGVLLPEDLRIEGLWPQNSSSCSMNWLELQAVSLSLGHFLPQLQGRLVLIMTDNTTVVSCLRRQSTLRSETLMSLSKVILEFCHLHDITLVPKYQAGCLDVLADQGSFSCPVSMEYSLDNHNFEWLSQNMIHFRQTHLPLGTTGRFSPSFLPFRMT